MPNEPKTVPVPPRAESSSDLEETRLVEIPDVEPRDPAEVAIQTFRLVRDMALKQELDRKQWQSLAKRVTETESRLGVHDQEIATLKTQVEGGVHLAIAPAEMPDPAPVPRYAPMRAPMNTHESINALTMETKKSRFEQRKFYYAAIGVILASAIKTCSASDIQTWFHQKPAVMSIEPAPAPSR